MDLWGKARHKRRWTQRRLMLDELQVVAWDGEGLGHPDHKYVLLANSLGLELRNLDGLPTLEILDAVWRTGRANRDAYQVMYGATYDWNNWLKDVDMATAEWVHKGHPVRLGKYTVKYNGLWLDIERNGYIVTIWDMWRFWGQGFVAAMEDAFPDFHGLETIHKFKDLRGEFTEAMLDDVAAYNRLELEGLVMLVDRLFKDLAEAHIQRPGYLTGSGALAGSIMRMFGIAKHNEQPPAAVLEAVLRAFSAGRIEPWKFGLHKGPFIVHDIRSAYPNAMQHLPSFTDGTWEWVSELSDEWDDRMSVWHVEWDYTEDTPVTRRYYPFFHRADKGMVHYPIAGEGWQWWPEVITAAALGWKFKIHGGWVLRQANPSLLPFRWVPGLYERRRVLKAEGKIGAQRVLKYGLNSLYGKMCQARGSTADKPPANHNLAWAGWVTSHCRSVLMETAQQDPDAVAYVMTDSIAATHRFEVDEGDAIGQWEVKEFDQALIAQAGVGSLWKDSVLTVDKYRGFDKGTITPEAIIAQWKKNYRSRARDPIQTTTMRPVTLGTALVNEEWYAKWTTWQETARELDIYGGDGKRVLMEEIYKVRPWLGLINLSPFSTLSLADLRFMEMSQSTPYQPRWADADPMSLIEIEGVMFDDRVVARELEAGELA
jgi:hypothetical protein